MKTEILTYQSNDFVPYFPYEVSGEMTTPKNNCEGRSVRTAQIANLDLDFGQVWVYDIHKEYEENIMGDAGYVCLYTYHVWNINDGNLFDSIKQLEANNVPKRLHPSVGDEVMVVDCSYLQTLLNKGGSIQQQAKRQRQVIKQHKKILRNAKLAGYDMVYMAGFSWSVKDGFYLDTKTWNENIDIVEKKLEKVFSKSFVG